MYGCSKKPFSWNLHIPLSFFPAFISTSNLNDRPHTPQFRRQMWSCLSACCEMPLLADTREPSKHYFWTTTKTSYYNSPKLFHWAKLWFLILKNCSCQIFEDFVTQAMDQIHPVHCHHHGDPSRDITGSLFSSSSLNRAITMTGPWDHVGWPTVHTSTDKRQIQGKKVTPLTLSFFKACCVSFVTHETICQKEKEHFLST